MHLQINRKMKKLEPNRQLTYGVEDKPTHKSEQQIQGEIVSWYWNESGLERGLLFSVFNNAIDEVKGGIQKSLGRVSGVSDLIWLSIWGPLFIELKDHKGTQGKDQVEWELRISLYNYKYVVCRSLEQFKFILRCWIECEGNITGIEIIWRWIKHCEKHGIDKLTGEKKE